MRDKHLANRITIFRVILVPFFLLFSYTRLKWLCFLIFIIASASDLLDGYIARHYNQISVFGKFMDPLADKILVISAMCVFIEWKIMPAWAVAIVIFREFAISGLRLIAAQKNIVIAAANSGKIKTGATMVSIAVMLLFRDIRFLCVLGAGVIVATTIWSGTEYFIKNKKIFIE